MSEFTAREISERLAQHTVALCQEVLPYGHREAGTWRAGSVNGEKGASLSVNLDNGLWRDHANADDRGDALGLVAAVLFGGDIREAIKWAKAWLGLSNGAIARPAPPPTTAPKDSPAAKIVTARRRWSESRDPRGTIVEKYLNGRGLELADDIAGHVIRFHPDCPWKDSDDGPIIWVPAMICAMRHIATDEIVGVSRRWLTPAGEKVGKPKFLGAAKGAAIKLDADDIVTGGLHIAEGAESGLDARQRGFAPCWAAGSADAVGEFPVLAGVECLTIICENDAVNERETAKCTGCWQDAGREVLHARPLVGKDINDARRAP
jgi:hypothetical protein